MSLTDMLVEQIVDQSERIRLAVHTVSPDAPVPTCPKWTVADLVGHLGRVHDSALKGLDADPDGPWPPFVQPPPDWPDALAFWTERGDEFVARLPKLDPDAPAWVFSPAAEKRVSFWIRLVSHEMALHRLDAEHATIGGDAQRPIESIAFDPEFAADGIEEFFAVLIPSFFPRRGEPVEQRASVYYAAEDIGRGWRVELRPGELPVLGDPVPDGVDVTVRGTADAVYRCVWGRPNTATVDGDAGPLHKLRAP